VGRPCANRFCDEQLPDDARPDRKWCSDVCGREARRIRRNTGRSRDLRRAERFWRRAYAIKRLAPGQALKSGNPRHTQRQTPQEVTA
jgi:hypothetical protein